MIDKSALLNHLKRNDLAVLSTSTVDGKTESALMAITVTDDLTIYLNSEANSRKVINILSNCQVSLVVGGFKNDPSVQIDGVARILDNQESVKAKEYMLSVNPNLASYFSDQGRFISVTPEWARYSDYSSTPPIIEEVEL